MPRFRPLNFRHNETVERGLFLWIFVRNYKRWITWSIVGMLCATVISLFIPLAAKEVVTYGGASNLMSELNVNNNDNSQAPANTQALTSKKICTGGTEKDCVTGNNPRPASVATPTTIPEKGVTESVTDGLGSLTEKLILWALPKNLGRSEFDQSDKVTFVQGLLCRSIFMAGCVIFYHLISLIAHLIAYYTGILIQLGMEEESLRCILHTSHPERIAVVNPVKLSQIITASAKTSGWMISSMLTDVVSCIFSSVGMLVALLWISARLTLIIVSLVLCIQYLYFLSGKTEHEQSALVTKEESTVQAYLSNAISRSETIAIFNCRTFILQRFQHRLNILSDLSNNLNLSIHGHAAINSSFTTLIFVLVLGLSNYYHRQGKIALGDVALYFLFLFQFVNRLLQLSKDISVTRAVLGRLQILKSLLEWYAEGNDLVCMLSGKSDAKFMSSYHKSTDVTIDSGIAAINLGGAQIHSMDDATAPLALEDVSFTYPAIPPFLAEDFSGSCSVPDSVTSVTNAAAAGNTAASLSGFPVPAANPTLAGGAMEHNAANTDKVQLNRMQARRGGILGVSLAAQPGKITALYGPSGSGKSTCLRIFARLVKPQRGAVYTQQNAVLLEQNHAVFIASVAENILLQDLHISEMSEAVTKASRKASKHVNGHSRGSSNNTNSSSSDSGRTSRIRQLATQFVNPILRQRVQQAIVRSGCASFLTDPFNMMIDNVEQPPFSGGQLQRICLARVFAVNEECTLVLLDEPTTGLDTDSVNLLLITIKELRDVYHKTVLISTHDHRVAEIADSVIQLEPSA